MAAGLGFKTFAVGEVLSAANVNGYLMQGVLVFANAAARDAAITSPQEGQCCYLKDTDAVQTYSGSAWVGFDDSNAIQNSIVDAKGDIVAASGNDTPARLAVGNNGETLVADSSTATGLRYQPSQAAAKNFVIGGGFDIWQRGAGAFTTSGGYTADRWFCQVNAGTISVSRDTSVPTTSGFNYSATITGTSATAPQMVTRIESLQSTYFAGQTVTLSFWAKVASGTGNLYATSWYPGTTDNWASPTQDTTQNWSSPSSSWTKYTHTFTVNANATKGYQIVLYLNTTTSNSSFSITGVQLELGSVATQFSRAGGTIQGELAACQRYLPSVPAVGGDTAMGQCFSTTQALIVIPFQVTPRVAPSGVTVTAGNFQVRNISAVFVAVTALTFTNANQTSACLQATVASGLTAGSATILYNAAPGLILFTGCEL